MEKNENNHYRGLHIVVINPRNCKVETAKVFDTYNSSFEFDKLILDEIPQGHILIAACQDDCITKLSYDAKTWFTSMSSREILRLKYREGFAFIHTVGKMSCNEKKSSN